ncbi:MAG: glycosyltransferase family 2 protein [Rhizobacter sp.]
MNPTPVSIITVCFNSVQTLRTSLESVAGQRHTPIEHIVIDGGSTDGTADLIRSWRQHTVRLISEPDQGIYDAMNKGLVLATGDYVGFLNADDMLATPDSIGQLVAAAAERPDALFADIEYVDAIHTEHVVRHWRAGPFRPDRLRYGWMPPHPAFYLCRNLLSEVGNFDTSLRIAADYDFMMRCLTRPGFDARYVPGVLVKMRLGGVSNSSLRNMIRKSIEDLSVMRRHQIGGWGTLMSKNFRKLVQLMPQR